MADAEWLSAIRHRLRQDDIDEIVSWQLTGIFHKKAPVYRSQPRPLCRHCHGEWHGLPYAGCPGSFDDTPPENQ